MDWYPLWNSLRIAAISTFSIFFAGIFATYYIAKLPRLIKSELDVILTLPLVLPPTLVGYLLLHVLDPNRLWKSLPFSGRVARNHARCVVFSERARKRQHRTGKNALPAVWQPDAPEDVGVGKPQRLAGVSKRLVKCFECTAHRPVYERKNDHDGCKNRRPPRHDHLDAERFQNPRADEPPTRCGAQITTRSLLSGSWSTWQSPPLQSTCWSAKTAERGSRRRDGAFVDIEKKLGSFHLRANLTVETEKLALLGASGCVSSCRWTVRRRLEAFCRFPSGKRRCFSINDTPMRAGASLRHAWAMSPFGRSGTSAPNLNRECTGKVTKF